MIYKGTEQIAETNTECFNTINSCRTTISCSTCYANVVPSMILSAKEELVVPKILHCSTNGSIVAPL